MTGTDDFIDREHSRFLSQLEELLRIPSVSANPANASACRQAAEWVRDHLLHVGCPTAELLGSDIYPVVHALGPTMPDKPTVLVYGHYDVQPPDPMDEWETPPFEPHIRDGYVYARGATDDKGQFLALIDAFETCCASGLPPVNLRFLIEGQEETNGEVLSALIRERPDLVRADVVAIADGPFYAPGWPAVMVGVRGICYVEIVVRTLREDLHSGLYGGVAPNAYDALVHILSTLKTPNGYIQIPGIYDSVRPPTTRERESWSRLPMDAAQYTRDEVGASSLIGDITHSIQERTWALPTLDIHGIAGGFTGEGVKTVIPSEARAKVSLRLVPDQRAQSVFADLERHVRANAPDWANVTIRPLALSEPTLVDSSHPAFGMLDGAFSEVFGRGVSLIRSGGTLPIVAELGRGGGAVIVTGIGLPTDRLHAPNERISLQQFRDGIRVFARFFEQLGTLERGGS